MRRSRLPSFFCRLPANILAAGRSMIDANLCAHFVETGLCRVRFCRTHRHTDQSPEILSSPKIQLPWRGLTLDLECDRRSGGYERWRDSCIIPLARLTRRERKTDETAALRDFNPGYDAWGQSRPSRNSSKSGHVRYAAASGSKFRALVALRPSVAACW
jgi:hypothetical protein